MKIFNLFSVLFGILGGVMGYLFGGFDILIITLLCMTALDYVTGVLCKRHWVAILDLKA